MVGGKIKGAASAGTIVAGSRPARGSAMKLRNTWRSERKAPSLPDPRPRTDECPRTQRPCHAGSNGMTREVSLDFRSPPGNSVTPWTRFTRTGPRGDTQFFSGAHGAFAPEVFGIASFA